MKKRHKGYFKKPTGLTDKHSRNYLKMKLSYSCTPKFRIKRWVKLYLSEIIK